MKKRAVIIVSFSLLTVLIVGGYFTCQFYCEGKKQTLAEDIDDIKKKIYDHEIFSEGEECVEFVKSLVVRQTNSPNSFLAGAQQLRKKSDFDKVLEIRKKELVHWQVEPSEQKLENLMDTLRNLNGLYADCKNSAPQ